MVRFVVLTLREHLNSMTGTLDKWIRISELSDLFGVSEESIRRLAKSQGFPLRRLTPYAIPGVLESELLSWLNAQPRIGRPIRAKESRRKRR